MSVQNLFNDITKTKLFKIQIDDITLNNEDISKLEIKFDMYNPCITGILLFKDSNNIFNSNKIKINSQIVITIIITDRYQDTIKYKFKPVDICPIDADLRFKSFLIKFTDIITLVLMSSYNSFNIKGDLIQNIKSSISNLGIDYKKYYCNSFFDEKYTSYNENLNIPANTNLYTFFIERLQCLNINLWYSHFAVNFKTINVQNLNNTNITYSTEITNPDNRFKIHNFVSKLASKGKIQLPLIRYTTTSCKQHTISIVTIKDLIKSVELNNNALNYVDSDFKTIIDLTDSYGANLKVNNLIKQMINQNLICIYVAGAFKIGDVGNIVNIKIGSKSTYTEQQLAGDVVTSGRYIIIRVYDLFLGTKFVQKIILGRFDNPKPLKI